MSSNDVKDEMMVKAGLGIEMLKESIESKLNKNIYVRLANKLMIMDKNEDLTYIERAKTILKFIRTIERNAKL